MCSMVECAAATFGLSLIITGTGGFGGAVTVCARATPCCKRMFGVAGAVGTVCAIETPGCKWMFGVVGGAGGFAEGVVDCPEAAPPDPDDPPPELPLPEPPPELPPPAPPPPSS